MGATGRARSQSSATSQPSEEAVPRSASGCERRALAALELSFVHTALITNLDEAGASISALVERAGMRKQSMGQLVNELEARGYVRRTRDPNDRRAHRILFADRGRRLLRDAREAKDVVEAEYAAVVGEEGVERLTELLRSLVDADA